MASSTATGLPGTVPYGDGRELEWQFACTDLAPVSRWLSGCGTVDGLRLEPCPTLQIHDTYFDTDDWRIHRAGFSLRIRSIANKSQATLKSLHSASAEYADRRELSEALQGPASESIRRLSGPVGMRVRALSGTRPMRPLFEVRTSRQRFAVRGEAGPQPLGEIALDDSVISHPQGAPRTSLRRVEVEALTGNVEALSSFVATLRRNCGIEPAVGNKYSHGLECVGLRPERAPDPAPAAIDASMSIAAVALANLRQQLAAWYLHEPGARLGDDPEELHDLRVAGRRLDAILRQFRRYLPDSLLRFRPTLKSVLRSLGLARDMDVALSELETFSSELPESERQSGDSLRKHLLAERDLARERMLSVLDSIWVQKALQEFVALVADDSAAAHGSAEPAVRAAPQIVGRRHRKLRRRAARLSADSSIEEFHAVRDQVKKLRYTLEVVASLYGKRADRMLRALRRWQERLGLQQDAAVAGHRFQRLADSPPDGIEPATMFLLGRLAEHYGSAAMPAHKRQPKGYRRIANRWKKLRLAFEKSAAGERFS